MSLEPLGTSPHAVTIRKRYGFFPITFRCLTMPSLCILFQNWLVMFVWIEAAAGLAKPPAPKCPALASGDVGMAGECLPPSLTAASRAGSRVCPQALQVPVEESGELTASARHNWLFPSSPFCEQWCLAFHAPHAAPGSRGGKRGKEQVDFV